MPNFKTFFIKRFNLTALLIVGIIGGGIFSLFKLPVEAYPRIEVPVGIVLTKYDGNTEELITKPLEQAIHSLKDVESTKSSSGQNFSLIYVFFDINKESSESMDALRQTVEKTHSLLPPGAKIPEIRQVSTEYFSLMAYSLTGDVTDFKLQKLAEDFKKELETLEEIEKIEIIGLQEREIQISLIPEKLKKYSLTIENVKAAISGSNISIPLGIIETQTEEIPLKYEKEIKSIEEIENIQIGRLKLKDIAEIKESFSDKKTYSQIKNSEGKSQKAISLLVYAKSGSDILKTGDKTVKIVDKFSLKNKLKENKIEIIKTNDLSSWVKRDVSNLLNNGWQTFLIILIILFFALSFKESIIAALTIPLSLFVVFISSNLRGLSINHISLLGMILSLGMLIDTAIVIMEGIHENLKKGDDPFESAIKSVKRFQWGLLAATLTTLAALLPLMLISGPIGKMFREMPLTLIIILSAALLINLTLSPSLAVKFLKTPQSENIIKFQQKKSVIKTWYGEKLKNLLKSNIKSTLLILYVLILFVLSIILPAKGILPRVLFPNTDTDYANVLIKAKPGTSLQKTSEIVNQIEEKLITVPEIKLVLSNIGTDKVIGSTTKTLFLGGESLSSSNLATIAINFKPRDERERKSYEIIPELKENLKDIPSEITIEAAELGPPKFAPIQITIKGEDTQKLLQIAEDIKKMLLEIEGPMNVKINNENENFEYLLTFNENALAKYGLNSLNISNFVRNILGYKEKLSTLKKGEKEIALIIQYKNDIRKTKEVIEQTKIPLPKGGTVSLSKIAKIEWQRTVDIIEHKDGKRAVTILSEIEESESIKRKPSEILKELDSKLEDYSLPENYEIVYGGEIEEIVKSFDDLFDSLYIAVILIAIILVIMFNSLKQPLLILLTIPISLIGVFPALYIFGIDLSFPAMIGIIALSGIVVNDAIILIDRINKTLENSGLPLVESICEAAKSRLKPIFLTSSTTILGVLPLAFSDERWNAICISLIAGLIASTLGTLTMIPVLYNKFAKKNVRRS